MVDEATEISNKEELSIIIWHVVSANSLSSVIKKYTAFHQLWEDILETISNTTMKARMQGIASQMTHFGFFIGQMQLRSCATPMVLAEHYTSQSCLLWFICTESAFDCFSFMKEERAT